MESTTASSPRTIAHALRAIKRLKGRFEELTNRALKSATWVDETVPAFPFEETDKELKEVSAKIVAYKAAVAVANASVTVEFRGKVVTLCALIHTLDERKGRIAYLGRLPAMPSKETVTSEARYEYEDGSIGGLLRVRLREGAPLVQVKKITHVARTEAEIADEIAQLRQELDEIDNVLQEANHRTEITVE